MKQRIFTLLFIIILLGMSAFAVLAQDDEPEVTPEPLPDETIAVDVSFLETGTTADEPVNKFLNMLAMLVYAPGAVGIVTVLTSITKRFVTFINANLIALIYFVLFWVLFMAIRNFGFEPEIAEQFLNGITEVGYGLLAITGTQIVSGMWYQKANAASVPIVGYSKSDGHNTVRHG